MQLKPLLAFIFLLFFNVCMRSDVFSIAVIVICYAVNAFNIVSDVFTMRSVLLATLSRKPLRSHLLTHFVLALRLSSY
jgi:hypothetical protein